MENGHVVTLPAITLSFDEQTQQVFVKWDPHFTNLLYIRALIEQGLYTVEQIIKQQSVQGMMQAVQQSQADEVIRKTLARR